MQSKWTVEDSWRAIGTSAVLYAAIELFSWYIHGGGSHVARMPSNARGAIESVLLTESVFLAPVYYFGIYLRGARASDFGFVRFRFWRAIGLILLGFGIYFFVALPWAIFMLRMGFEMQPDMLKMFGSGLSGLLLALAVGGLLAPVAEETVFRGFFFGGLRTRYPLWLAAGISGIIFGAAHLMPAAIVPLATLGIIFAWLRERTGSIWPGILMHMFVNTIGFTARFFIERH